MLEKDHLVFCAGLDYQLLGTQFMYSIIFVVYRLVVIVYSTKVFVSVLC